MNDADCVRASIFEHFLYSFLFLSGSLCAIITQNFFLVIKNLGD